MTILETLQSGLTTLVPTVATIVGVILFLNVAGRLIEHHRVRHANPRIMAQLAMALLACGGLLLIILALPVSETTRGQIYSLVGIVVSASIALSSSTFVGNAMAGLLIRIAAGHRLRLGDYIRVEEYAGRVTELGILHTQIQTETRDLMWLPNLWLVNRPSSLRQRAGTIVNTTLSLGYDVDRIAVKDALLEAAETIGLTKPFVRIEELGNHSVTYKVGGLLIDLTRLWRTHSALRAAVLDALHDAGIEVLSPNFVSSRPYPPEKTFIPKPSSRRAEDETISEDELMFGQAVAAGELDRERRVLLTELAEATARRDAAKGLGERSRLAADVETLKKKLAELDES